MLVIDFDGNYFVRTTDLENINIMLKFADDTKLGHRSDSMEDIDCQQTAINSLMEWAGNWCMKFNVFAY